jgi:hypothetical protein
MATDTYSLFARRP